MTNAFVPRGASLPASLLVALSRRGLRQQPTEPIRRPPARRRRPAASRISWSMSATACSSNPIRPSSRRSRAPPWRSRRSGCSDYNRYTFTIEGHADERGTREYNIALGARRAQTVRDYLASRGVEPQRMRTISYGKERPVAVCNDISCWSQNRRAVTVLNSQLLRENTGEGDSRRLRAPAVFCNAPGFPFQTRDRNFGGGGRAPRLAAAPAKPAPFTTSRQPRREQLRVVR